MLQTVELNILLVCYVVTFILVWPSVRLFRQLAPSVGLIDVPNLRSSHVGSIPLAGGTVFVILIPLVSLVVARQAGILLGREDWALLITGWFIAFVSLVDDWRPLPARVRLVAQVWAALGLIIYGRYLRYFGAGGFGVIDVGWLGVLITFVWILGMSNAFNFMDGMDGLVAGQSVIAALAVAWLSMSTGLDWIAILSAALGGGLLGFLLHNLPPARVFMGDVGSIWLGFIFAGMAVIGAPRSGERLSLGFWVLLLGIFLLDSGLTLGRRILQGEPVLEAHRTHYYQRLLRVGWGHRRVTALYLVMAAVLAAVAVIHFDFWRLPFSALVIVGLMAFAGTYALVHYVESYKVELESERGSPLGKVTAGGLLKPFRILMRRSGTALLSDGFVVIIAYAIAFGLLFAQWESTYYEFFVGIRDGIIAIVFVHLTLNLVMGIYVGRLPLLNGSAILKLFFSSAFSGMALILGEILLGPVRAIPITVLVLGAAFACMGFTAVRYARSVKFQSQ